MQEISVKAAGPDENLPSLNSQKMDCHQDSKSQGNQGNASALKNLENVTERYLAEKKEDKQ